MKFSQKENFKILSNTPLNTTLGKSIIQVPDTGTSSIGQYWNIFDVPVLPKIVIFTFFRTCWCYSEAYITGTQKWSSIVQYLCTSIWDLKYTFFQPYIRKKGQFTCALNFFPKLTFK